MVEKAVRWREWRTGKGFDLCAYVCEVESDSLLLNRSDLMVQSNAVR